MKTVSRLAMIAVLLGTSMGIGVVGCDESDGSVGPFDDAALTPAGAEVSEGGAGPLAALTVEMIDARVRLSEGQRTQMQRAIADLRGAKQEMRGHRGRGRHAAMKGEPPMVTFMEQASKILTPDQFRDFALLVKEQRNARIAGLEARRDDRRGPQEGLGVFGRRAAKHLDLSSEQQERLKPIVRGHADEIRSIRLQTRNGEISRDQGRERIRALRLKMRDEAKSVLTPEQWEKAESFRQERGMRRIEQRAAHLDEHLGRRAEFLTRVLGLDGGQAQQVRGLILGTVPARTEILNRIRSGAIESEDAAARVAAIEKSLEAQMTVLLTPEQSARWDAVSDLIPMRGR